MDREVRRERYREKDREIEIMVVTLIQDNLKNDRITKENISVVCEVGIKKVFLENLSWYLIILTVTMKKSAVKLYNKML